MMKKFCVFILVVLFVPSIYFSSCAKDDFDDDREPPTVSDVAFNVNDTVKYGDDILNQSTIKLNDSTKVKAEKIDTLVIGKWLRISARFRDDQKLSTFKVKGLILYKDQEGNVYTDTLVRLGQNIFGETDTMVIRNRLVLMQDTVQKWNKEKKGYVNAGIIPGDYDLFVVCMDVTSKVNLDSMTAYPIRILPRETILDALAK